MNCISPVSIARTPSTGCEQPAGGRARSFSSLPLAILMGVLVALSPAALAQTIPTRAIINGDFENFQISNDAVTPVAGFTAPGG